MASIITATTTSGLTQSADNSGEERSRRSTRRVPHG
jgi:hypothetical protein